MILYEFFGVSFWVCCGYLSIQVVSPHRILPGLDEIDNIVGAHHHQLSFKLVSRNQKHHDQDQQQDGGTGTIPDHIHTNQYQD
jgi:hypothetical protein